MTAPQLFRFEAYWLRYPAARDEVSRAWASTSSAGDQTRSFSSKLSSASSNLKTWSTGLSSALSKQANLCMFWIEWLDGAEELRSLLLGEASLRCRLKVRFDELLLLKELKWKQRSRVQWLKAGDANAKFFHLKASARRNKNFITRLTIGQAVPSDHASITSLLFSFFRSHLGSASSSSGAFNYQVLFGGPDPDLLGLHDPFSEEEIKLAVFALSPKKAPGPDGFPLLFYQRFWGTVKGDLMSIFAKLHSGCLDLAFINKGWICLIPKKPAPLEIRDYRPISLVNGLVKIISKALATRFQSVMGGLINSCQTAFIKDRSLLDNFLSAHILTHHLYSLKQPSAFLKIDFERAFDQVSWPFLLDLLRVRGFSERWICWISSLISSALSAVLLNGSLGAFFNSARGLRQGDPLSPLLFNLCVDVLHRLL